MQKTIIQIASPRWKSNDANRLILDGYSGSFSSLIGNSFKFYTP